MASGVQTLIQKYAVPALVGLALTGGVALLQSHDAAVARKALTKAFTDSIVAVHTVDSTAAAQRDSAFAVTLAASTSARKVALAHAEISEQKADSLQGALTSAPTLSDSVVVLVHLHTQDSSTIADLHLAIARFTADSVVRDEREQSLRTQLAAANHTIGTLIARVNSDAKSGLLNSTPVKVSELILAGYGAVKLGQATHLIP
jgi:hypothetical protein